MLNTKLKWAADVASKHELSVEFATTVAALVPPDAKLEASLTCFIRLVRSGCIGILSRNTHHSHELRARRVRELELDFALVFCE